MPGTNSDQTQDISGSLNSLHGTKGTGVFLPGWLPSSKKPQFEKSRSSSSSNAGSKAAAEHPSARISPPFQQLSSMGSRSRCSGSTSRNSELERVGERVGASPPHALPSASAAATRGNRSDTQLTALQYQQADTDAGSGRVRSNGFSRSNCNLPRLSQACLVQCSAQQSGKLRGLGSTSLGSTSLGSTSLGSTSRGSSSQPGDSAPLLRLAATPGCSVQRQQVSTSTAASSSDELVFCNNRTGPYQQDQTNLGHAMLGDLTNIGVEDLTVVVEDVDAAVRECQNGMNSSRLDALHNSRSNSGGVRWESSRVLMQQASLPSPAAAAAAVGSTAPREDPVDSSTVDISLGEVCSMYWPPALPLSTGSTVPPLPQPPAAAPLTAGRHTVPIPMPQRQQCRSRQLDMPNPHLTAGSGNDAVTLGCSYDLGSAEVGSYGSQHHSLLGYSLGNSHVFSSQMGSYSNHQQHTLLGCSPGVARVPCIASAGTPVGSYTHLSHLGCSPIDEVAAAGCFAGRSLASPTFCSEMSHPADTMQQQQWNGRRDAMVSSSSSATGGASRGIASAPLPSTLAVSQTQQQLEHLSIASNSSSALSPQLLQLQQPAGIYGDLDECDAVQAIDAQLEQLLQLREQVIVDKQAARQASLNASTAEAVAAAAAKAAVCTTQPQAMGTLSAQGRPAHMLHAMSQQSLKAEELSFQPLAPGLAPQNPAQYPGLPIPCNQQSQALLLQAGPTGFNMESLDQTLHAVSLNVCGGSAVNQLQQHEEASLYDQLQQQRLEATLYGSYGGSAGLQHCQPLLNCATVQVGRPLESSSGLFAGIPQGTSAAVHAIAVEKMQQLAAVQHMQLEIQKTLLQMI